MYDLRRLTLLVELRRRGTIAAVGQAVGLSPSAISQQLSLLAEEAGTLLLEPFGRKVRLTRQAEILAERAESAIAELEEARSEVARSLGKVEGPFKIATFQTAAIALVPLAIEELGRRHSGLELFVSQLEAEQSIPALLARDFDLIIAEEFPGMPLALPAAAQREELWLDSLRIGLRRSAEARAGPRALARLVDLPWVLEPSGTPARGWAERLFASCGIVPVIRFESTDVLMHRCLVERGLAYGFLPDLVWAGRKPTVRLIDLSGRWGWRRIVTAVRRGQESHPAVLAVREALRSALS
jgi:DNA-binding transcriptional LysR family regulator